MEDKGGRSAKWKLVWDGRDLVLLKFWCSQGEKLENTGEREVADGEKYKRMSSVREVEWLASPEKCSSPSIVIEGKGEVCFRCRKLAQMEYEWTRTQERQKLLRGKKITKLSWVTAVTGSRNWGLPTSSLHIYTSHCLTVKTMHIWEEATLVNVPMSLWSWNNHAVNGDLTLKFTDVLITFY